MNALVRAIDPPAPADVRAAGDDLHYRDFLTVALVVPEAKGFPDNWIYIHAPEVAGRAHPELRLLVAVHGQGGADLPRPRVLRLRGRRAVVEHRRRTRSSGASASSTILGLVQPADVEAGYVVRVPKAYPYYDFAYQANVETITKYLDEAAPNVHPVGRNGMHKYNNQDHSMYTAMLTVENILGADHDIWAVNVEEEYHEVQSGGAAREAGGPVGTRRCCPAGSPPGSGPGRRRPGAGQPLDVARRRP